MKISPITRRHFLQSVGALGAMATMESLLPSYARAASALLNPDENAAPDVIDLVVAENRFKVGGRTVKALTVNGTVPGPLVRLREGHDTIIRVTNRLKESTSIHWHGVLVPSEMDGVPGVSFPGIDPGKTFEYRYTPKQNGTYWYHSHTGTQEQQGIYGPMIIDPADTDPIEYDREYIVLFSDWPFDSPHTIMRKLKAQGDYYDFQQQTLRSFLREAKEKGFRHTWEDYKMWTEMRMSPTDLADVTAYAYTYLINGMSAEDNWTGVFNQGEKVRLRFINASSMTIYDVRIPDLGMTVVAADGQNVQPVDIDEFRIGNGEIYDIIVQPNEDRAYTIFAETTDRSGYARGTLAPRVGMSAAIPERRPRPLLTMLDMGMADHDHHGGHGGHGDHDAHEEEAAAAGHNEHAGHDEDNDAHAEEHHETESPIPHTTPVPSTVTNFGPGNEAVPTTTVSRIHEAGTGLGEDGRKVLRYTDLRALEPFYDQRPPERELIVYITGHMGRHIWSFDGKKYSEEPYVEFRHGERLRLTLVNYTMMEHPIHIHGMWYSLENGHGEHLPRKHTIIVKPAERMSLLVTADAPGHWAFHCHLLYHMLMGMMRVINVTDAPLKASPQTSHETMSAPGHEKHHGG